MTILLRTVGVWLALFTIANTSTFAQGDFCAVFEEFCPAPDGSDLSFPAGVNSGDAEPGNAYGCLATQPNPAWYYVQIGAPGAVTIQLFNSNNVDIDFALWGPYADLDAAQDDCGSLPLPLDCSYSIASAEVVQIPFSNPDDIYILLITNYSNDPTNINAEATGDGVPVCCRTPINQAESCPEAFDFDCGCWTTGITGTLPASNPGPAIPDFCGSLDNQQWLRFEACWCAISMEVFAPECTDGAGVEAQLFSSCAPFEAVTDCVVIPPGQSALLTAPAGDTIIHCTPGEEYTLLLDGVAADGCDYIARANVINLPPPVLQLDTIFGPTEVCILDTISYAFPPFSGQGECTASFAGNGEVLSVDHGNIVVAFGDTPSSGGLLCVSVNACEGADSYCMEVDIIQCCFSEAGTLDFVDWQLCPEDAVQVTHQGDSLIEAIDTAYYVLHDGTADVLGNVLATSPTGNFPYDPAYAFNQVYYVQYLVTRFANGQPDYSACFFLSDNGNPVTWYADMPQLGATPEQYDCDDEARTYRVSFELANGVPPYRVDGELVVGNVFTSSIINSGEAYSFAVTSENPCLDTLFVSGSYTCPCETDAGTLDPTLVELCGSETLTVTAENAVLDVNDVLVYQLRALDGTLRMQNSDGIFGYAPVVDYGTVYEISAVAGNDTGNGPLTGYPCASESNTKQVVFYDEVTVTGPAEVEIRCNDPNPLLATVIRGGSGEYTYIWDTPQGPLPDSVTLRANGPGIYTLNVGDVRSSCMGSASISVVEAPIITDFVAQLVEPLCTGDDNGSIVLDSVIGGVPPFRFQLDEKEEVSLPVFEFLPAGDYDLAIRDANDCEFVTKITLEDPIAPQLDLGPDQTIALGEIATVTAQTNVSNPNIRWFIDGVPFADSLFTFDSLFVNNAFVEAEVFDANDCNTNARVLILLDKESPLFVPTAFSPNEDGVNDRLTVFGNPAAVDLILDMQIYDRWGSQVYANAGFAVNEQFTGWDGFFRGQRAGTGIYVWTVSVRYIDGRTERTSGEVLLMR